MADSNDPIQNGITQAVNAAILAELDGPRRDAIITKAVQDFVKDYAVRRVCEELIQQRAKDKARELVESGKYDSDIVAAIEAGLAAVVARIPAAVTQAVIDALFGRDGKDSYSRFPGLILRHFPKDS